MQKNTVVLIHGYAEKGESFQGWKLKLEALGYTVNVLGYISLSDEVTLKDIAEGFERALHLPGGLKNDEPFDVIVHSTGMLVIRTWLAAYPEQRHRLQHIIGLAPASFGSPIAHKARSFMAKLMRSNREWGENFFESGYRILDALELGSRYIWDLTHQDLLSSDSIYLNNGEPPYVFIFCGTSEYGGLKKMIRQAGSGTDGTVRWVGCSLNTRKITIHLTKPSTSSNQINIGAWQNTSVVSMVPIAGLNHATILKQPTDALVEMVDAALQVSKQYTAQDWIQKYSGAIKSEYDKIADWQQFIVRAVDENGDAIPDYALKLVTKINGEYKSIEGINEHVYARDTSLRCFQVNINSFKTKQIENIWLQISASSGSQLVIYKGYTSSQNNQTSPNTTVTWQGEINLTDTLYNSDQQILQPLTTTLVELCLNREPCQQGIDANNKVSWFLSV
jgi:hypothetical protein